MGCPNCTTNPEQVGITFKQHDSLGRVGYLERISLSRRLEELLKKREQLNAQIQKARARESAQKRQEDTRRKILLGALMMQMMEKGELDKDKILKKLSSFLTREIDRKLFDLPLKEKKKSAELTAEVEPEVDSTRTKRKS